ncbi:protein of unknown function [Cupriavidus taiwanensis]|uniref:Uncharacterized protein n=1 Tax=Cupriavidus taiwanensis TaxID=164546 RepID=A0A375I8Y0_9BURK|nr:protein of unknown function [Cupriavidus taiwanensis]
MARQARSAMAGEGGETAGTAWNCTERAAKPTTSVAREAPWHAVRAGPQWTAGADGCGIGPGMPVRISR